MPASDHTHHPHGWDQAAHYAAIREPLTVPYGLDALTALSGQPGDRLLDVAAGTGGVAIAAARLGLTVTAVDASQAMATYASNRAAEEQTALDVRVMDGQALTFADGTFDLALSVFGVIMFPDHRRGLAEMRRVLRPGGRAAVVSWATPDRMAHLEIWQAAIRAEYPGSPGLDRPAGWRSMDAPDALANEMTRAGFGRVETRPLRHAWAVPSADWLIEHGPGGNLFQRLGPGSRERIRTRLLNDLQEHYGNGPLRLAADAYLGLGTTN